MQTLQITNAIIALAPHIGFFLGLVGAGIAFRLVVHHNKACADCGSRLNLTEGSHCHHSTALKRSILQAEGDRAKGLQP